MKKLSAIILSILLLSGCSTAYQKRGYDGGYDEMKLSSNSYLVEYTSNANTDHSTNTIHALRRAAELTKQDGFQYFEIVKISDTSSQYTTPIVATSTSNANSYDSGTHNSYGYGRGSYDGSSHANGISSTVVSGGNKYIEPGVAIVITMLNSKTNKAYDADVILSNFKKDK